MINYDKQGGSCTVSFFCCNYSSFSFSYPLNLFNVHSSFYIGTGSILAFPSAVFLWNVRQLEDLDAESLAPILLYRPTLEYLFLGSSKSIPQETIQSIRKELRNDLPNLVVEQLDLSNAMGTFNVLNGEDRSIVVGLILPPDDDQDN